MNINPYLLERLRIIHAAYQNSPFSTAIAVNAKAAAQAAPTKNWRDLLDDDEDDEGGGRGTIKGLRGKDTERAKRAMRKLTRSR